MRKGKILKEVGTFELIVTITLLLYPILQIYAFVGGLSCDIIVVGVLFFLYFLRGGRFSVLPRPLFFYFLYAYFVSVCSFNGFQSFIPLGLLLNFSSMLVFWGTVNYDNLLKIYKVLAIVIVAFFFLQEFTYYTTGYRISGIATFLPIAIGGGDEWKEFHDLSRRSSSFFSEPAHFAQFLLPLVCVEIFRKDTIKSKLFMLLLIIALALSLSGNAIFGLILIFSSYGIYTVVISKSYKVKLIFCSFVISGALSAISFLNTEQGQDLMERAQTLKELSKTTKANSEYKRLLRGYDLYDELPTINKIVGIGDKDNLLNFISKSNISYMFGENDIYLNGMAAVMIHCGVIGVIILFLIIRKIWKGNNFVGKTLLSLLILLVLISSTYFNPLFALLLIMAYGEKKKYKEELVCYQKNIKLA